MKKDTLCDMVNNMSDKVAIVHQVPFTCDRIEPMVPSDSKNSSSSCLQTDRKANNQTRKQKRFVSTLEKVYIYLKIN